MGNEISTVTEKIVIRAFTTRGEDSHNAEKGEADLPSRKGNLKLLRRMMRSLWLKEESRRRG